LSALVFWSCLAPASGFLSASAKGFVAVADGQHRLVSFCSVTIPVTISACDSRRLWQSEGAPRPGANLTSALSLTDFDKGSRPMTNHHIKYPRAADQDIPEIANQLIAAIARAMLAEGESASHVAYMRRAVIVAICEFYPWAYRAKSRGAA
jgi:hypothetical protein